MFAKSRKAYILGISVVGLDQLQHVEGTANRGNV